MNVVLGIATIAAIILTVELLLKIFPTVARTVLGDDKALHRMSALDGLRGALVLSVFIHHGIMTRQFDRGQPWLPPPDNFDNLLGQVAVALFFMISAYLFWGRIVKKMGT